MYFTEAHHQGVVYLTETVSSVVCAYYNGIMYPRTKTEIQICDVAQYQDAEVPVKLLKLTNCNFLSHFLSLITFNF